MKGSTLSKFVAIFMLFILVSSVPATLAQDNDDHDDDDYEEEHEPEYERDDDGTVWIQTAVMTAMLDPEVPSYQLWYSADDNGTLARFRVAYLMIVEFEDANGDGVYQVNETVSFVPLDAFEWVLQTGTITNEAGQNEEVYASYTKGGLTGEDFEDDWFEDWMPGYEEEEEEEDSEDSSYLFSDDDYGLNLSKYEDVTVQFYAHMYLQDYHGSVSDDEGVQANYTIKGGVELKIDIEIGNFPFTSDTTKIAVLNYLQEDLASEENSNHRFRLHEDDYKTEIDSEDEWEDLDELGKRFEDEDDEVQEIELVEGSSNTTRGIYRWLDRAVMTLPNGSKQAVDVGASYWTHGNALLLFLAYPNFDAGSLLHDPSIRFLESSNPVSSDPIGSQVPLELAAVSAVAVISIAGVAVAYRKR